MSQATLGCEGQTTFVSQSVLRSAGEAFQHLLELLARRIGGKADEALHDELCALVIALEAIGTLVGKPIPRISSEEQGAAFSAAAKFIVECLGQVG